MLMRTCSEPSVQGEIKSVPVEQIVESIVMEDTSCRFCHVEQAYEIAGNELAFAMYDRFPVTKLHALVIPRRHIPSFFDLTQIELQACHDLLMKVRGFIMNEDPSVEGFNIGVNVGETAGQTILHCHIHLIPRRRGDVEDPKGGIRHLIPGKGFY